MIALLPALALAGAVADDIARAHELLARLDCDLALPLGHAIATHPAADEAELREGMLIAGYCLAASGRVGEAEELFKGAVAEDVQLQAGFPMERRIQYLLDAARAEVIAERARVAAERRAALAAQVRLSVVAPAQIVGGQRAAFVVRVEGKEAARIQSVKLEFRRPDDPEFYSLPVRRDDDGVWRGEIGGIYTRSTRAYPLQWFVTASDELGALQSWGSRAAPRALEVAAGSNVAEDLRARERLPPITRLLFAGVGAPTATTLVAFSVLVGASVVHSLDTLNRRRGDEVLGMLALLTVPVGMVATEYATTVWLLDGFVAYLPAIAVGGVSGIGGIAVLVALLRNASLDELWPTSGAVPKAASLYDVERGVAATAVTLAGLTAGAVPLALVAWDVAQEHE